MRDVKIILATGIYPPDIGGPATYVKALSERLRGAGHDVFVITYGNAEPGDEHVARVSRTGFFFVRWMRYARALKEQGKNADVVYCFSSVSCGFPLILSGLRGPKRVLRLGGDFAWERYTDRGGRRTLRQFYSSRAPLAVLGRMVLRAVFLAFDYIVFSTAFQRDLYRRTYRLSRHTVIENALPVSGAPVLHGKHDPLKVLFVGRFVRFKNLEKLVHAVSRIPLATLTLVGSGPVREEIITLGRTLQLQGRISTLPPMGGEELARMFHDHDVLILPSLTEISPNVALEGRANGIPVLLTEEHGLSSQLSAGMWVRSMASITEITKAILEIDHCYAAAAEAAAKPVAITRGWEEVTEDHLALFGKMLGT